MTIGIDLGGTKIEAALIDEHDAIRQKLREHTRASEGADAVAGQICDMASQLIESADSGQISAAGIGVAGQIEHATGVVRGAPNLGWQDYPLRDRLAEKLDLTFLIDNDVRMAAYGEWKLGAGRNTDHLLCIFVGTGIGGGIISDGRVLRGRNNTAGEIGHMTIDLNGPECRCGNTGCLEAHAGGWAIGRRAKQMIRETPAQGTAILANAGGDIESVTAKWVSKAALEGDPLAKEILGEAADALIAGCVSLVNILNPRILILGGGVIEGYPAWIEQIAAGVQERSLPAAAHELTVVKAELGGMAGVMGAACAARDLTIGKDERNDGR